MALGYEEPGQYPELEPDDPDSAEGLREWLEEELGLSPPATGAELVASAQKKNPDLMAWITKWQKERRGNA